MRNIHERITLGDFDVEVFGMVTQRGPFFVGYNFVLQIAGAGSRIEKPVFILQQGESPYAVVVASEDET